MEQLLQSPNVPSITISSSNKDIINNNEDTQIDETTENNDNTSADTNIPEASDGDTEAENVGTE